MTPELCLSSIPHNGTYFLLHLLMEHRPMWHDVGIYARPNPTPTVFHAHCTKKAPAERALELAKRMPLLMPLRHPYWVEESWRRRYPRRHIDDDLWTSYEHMLELLRPAVSVWFPVDGSELIRAQAVRDLELVCDAKFDVDFDRIVNSKEDTHVLGLAELTPSDRIREVRAHPFFTRYYGDIDSDTQLLEQA